MKYNTLIPCVLTCCTDGVLTNAILLHHRRRKYLGVVLALGLVSPSISLAFLYWETSFLHSEFKERSEKEPGLMAITR
jgi:hypothetical protein